MTNVFLYIQKIIPIDGAHSKPVHHPILLRSRGNEVSSVPPMAFISAAKTYAQMPLAM
jgi:hypothetical protein